MKFAGYQVGYSLWGKHLICLLSQPLYLLLKKSFFIFKHNENNVYKKNVLHVNLQTKLLRLQFIHIQGWHFF